MTNVESVVMIDTVGANASVIPASATRVGVYVTGSGVVPWPQAQIDRFNPGKTARIRIDQSPSLSVFAAGHADVADVEPGAGTVTSAVSAILHRQSLGLSSTVYCNRTDFATLVAALEKASVPLHNVGVWLADWSLSQAKASALLSTKINGLVCNAVQWASPSSNPSTTLPGTSLTLKESNCDLSVAWDKWFQPADEVPPPVAKQASLIKSTVITGSIPGTLTVTVTMSDGSTEVVKKNVAAIDL